MGFKPWLLLPPKLSHDLSPEFLKLLAAFKKWPKPPSKPSVFLGGLSFASPFGTAGGLDKKASNLSHWTKMGTGFLEIGTFTPKPQSSNSGVILKKSIKEEALWNSMGFPNAGFNAVLPKIEKFLNKSKDQSKYSPPLFINIGKNRETPLEEAHKDYLQGLKHFSKVADAFVINISSPNTKGLRDLHSEKNFKNFITPLIEAEDKPLILKISPDLETEAFKDFIELCTTLNIDGLTLTNTTASRSKKTKALFPEHGGVSGKPLAKISLEKLLTARKILDEKKSKQVLISVGGVMTPAQAKERIDSGADLVQFYSGLIFYGPFLLKDSADFFFQNN